MKINTKWQKPFFIKYYFKYKQIKISNLTAEIGRMDLKNVIHLFAVHRRIQFRAKDIKQLIVKGWENLLHVNSNQKRDRVALLIPGKTDFKVKVVRRDRGHYI